MIIIHGMTDQQDASALPRLLQETLTEDLKVMPAVVVTGSRQTGKSTLVRDLVEPDSRRSYFTLDDLDIVDLARSNPDRLVRGPGAVTLDEVQREPDLLIAVKRAIDEARRPGRFVLTGSANLLLMHKVSESLAGRASYLTLWPMTRRERLGMGRAGLWDELVETPDRDWAGMLDSQITEPDDLHASARRGGYPVPAVHLETDDERAIWFDGYVRTYLERDLQDLSAISALPEFRRLMVAASHRIGQLLNQTDLGRDVALPQPTVRRYLNLLETSYIIVKLQPFARNRSKRLIKSPKLYFADTGLALRLAGEAHPGGQHLENMVLADLLGWRESRRERPGIFYWRTATGEEVDFVIEAGNALIPVEVKSTAHPRVADARHLISFQDEYGGDSRSALLLHGGTRLEWITPSVLAAPWWRVV